MLQKSNIDEISALRHDARKHLEQGPITSDYQANRMELIQQLNQALATVLVCMLRYRCHYFMARGIYSRTVRAEFLAHSNEELGHADSLAARIVQLGGDPDFAPQHLDNSSAEYITSNNLQDMIRENLVAERISILGYREIIESIGEEDPTSCDLLKRILAVEEEHADDLASLLSDVQKNIYLSQKE
jgi:bacterioferritin